MSLTHHVKGCGLLANVGDAAKERQCLKLELRCPANECRTPVSTLTAIKIPPIAVNKVWLRNWQIAQCKGGWFEMLTLIFELYWPVRLILIKTTVKSFYRAWTKDPSLVRVPARLFACGKPVFSMLVYFFPIAVSSIKAWIERCIEPAVAEMDLCWQKPIGVGSFRAHPVLTIHLNGPTVRK